MKQSLELFSLRFPELRERAATLYDQQEGFRGLCDVFAVCVRAVKRSEASGSRELRAEYLGLQQNFEAELLLRLGQPGEESPRP